MANSSSPKKKRPAKAKKSRNNSHRNGRFGWLDRRHVLTGLLLFTLVFIAYLIYLDFRVVSRFQGKIWSLPSHVYARPLDLYVDKVLSAGQFEHELALLNYQKVSQIPTVPGQYRQWDGRHFELISRDFLFADGAQEKQALRVDFEQGRVVGLYELYGHQPTAIARLEPAMIAGIYPGAVEDRLLVKLEEVPEYLVLALLAVEDRRFYQHWGIDPRSIARALVANMTPGGNLQGGSTITQQLVKNLFLTSERSLWRKFNEALMALMLEAHFDKALILETYLNEVYLGQDGAQAVHGFALASRYYFDKPLNSLGKDQLALLVGLVKGASWYDPRRHPERALARRNQVLEQMADQQVISEAQLALFKSRPLGVAQRAFRAANLYPAFIDLVKKQLLRDYQQVDLQTAGLRIFTTLDPLVQQAAERAVTRVIPRLESQYASAEQLQTAAIVASPESGEIQALVADSNPRFPGFNRATDAVRQVGSLIKPAIYLAALSQPDKYNLASILNDSPLRLQERNGTIWEPQNYDKAFSGDILLYQALIQSRNVPTVRLGLDVGLAKIVDSLHRLGIERDVPPYPSITLGAFDLTPYEVASMYQTLAGKGFNIPLRAIREVLDNQGRALSRYPLKLQQTLNEDAVYLINHALHRVTTEGTASLLGRQLSARVAGKTGTTDDLRDSWFAGFSEDRLAVVWVGRDDNQSTGLTGSSGALKIWLDMMQRLPLQDLQLERPETIEMQWIDSQSGGLSKKACAGTVELPFISGSAPTQRAECTSPSLMDRLKGLFN
jgi:penicillin-binding protein 1B